MNAIAGWPAVSRENRVAGGICQRIFSSAAGRSASRARTSAGVTRVATAGGSAGGAAARACGMIASRRVRIRAWISDGPASSGATPSTSWISASAWVSAVSCAMTCTCTIGGSTIWRIGRSAVSSRSARSGLAGSMPNSLATASSGDSACTWRRNGRHCASGMSACTCGGAGSTAPNRSSRNAVSTMRSSCASAAIVCQVATLCHSGAVRSSSAAATGSR